MVKKVATDEIFLFRTEVIRLPYGNYLNSVQKFVYHRTVIKKKAIGII